MVCGFAVLGFEVVVPLTWWADLEARNFGGWSLRAYKLPVCGGEAEPRFHVPQDAVRLKRQETGTVL